MKIKNKSLLFAACLFVISPSLVRAEKGPKNSYQISEEVKNLEEESLKVQKDIFQPKQKITQKMLQIEVKEELFSEKKEEETVTDK